MSITDELKLKIRRVIQLLVIVHSLVNVGFPFQRFLNPIHVVVCLENVFHFVVQVQGQTIMATRNQSINHCIDMCIVHFGSHGLIIVRDHPFLLQIFKSLKGVQIEESILYVPIERSFQKFEVFFARKVHYFKIEIALGHQLDHLSPIYSLQVEIGSCLHLLELLQS